MGCATSSPIASNSLHSSATPAGVPQYYNAWAAFTQPPKIRPLERWPDGTLYEPWAPDDPDAPSDAFKIIRGNPIPVGPLFAGKRTLLVGMPGAFSPNCSRVHLPQYAEHAEELRTAGIDQIIVMVANDPCVLQGWPEAARARAAGIRIMCDRNCDVAQSTGLALDARGEIGRVTVHRFSALLEDGVVKLISTEPGGHGLTCTTAASVLHDIREKAHEKVVGPERPFERPPLALISRYGAGSSADASKAAGKPRATLRVNSTGSLPVSRDSNFRVGGRFDRSSSQGGRSYHGSYQDYKASSIYYSRFRAAETTPSTAEKSVLSASRVAVDVSAREQPSAGDSRGGQIRA